MKRKETKIRYLVNTAAVVVLFAVAVVIGLTGGDVMKLRITPPSGSAATSSSWRPL